MDRVFLSRMPYIEELGILIMLGVGHDEATGSEVAEMLARWCRRVSGSQLKIQEGVDNF